MCVRCEGRRDDVCEVRVGGMMCGDVRVGGMMCEM